MTFYVFLQGFVLSFALFFSANPQNSFIFKQGVRNEYILPVCVLFTCFGIILIQLSFKLFTFIFEQASFLIEISSIIFAVLLVVYGAQRIKIALDEPCSCLIVDQNEKLNSFNSAMGSALNFFISKPLNYIKDFVLLGALAFSFKEHSGAFTLGSMLGIALFFFSLGFMAKVLQPALGNEKLWKGINFLTALIMLLISLNIFMQFL